MLLKLIYLCKPFNKIEKYIYVKDVTKILPKKVDINLLIKLLYYCVSVVSN